MLLQLFFLQFLSQSQTHAKPVKFHDNDSLDPPKTVGFLAPNGGRDTLSLLFSCLATLLLCVYSAVHLNIPPKGETSFRTRLREIKWCIIGLFGPELVIFAAWRQWSSASTLGAIVSRSVQRRSSVQSVLNLVKKTSLSTEIELQQITDPQWNLVHGYYSTMGGFVIKYHSISTDEADAVSEDHKYLTVTARGIALLAECGYVPCVPEDEINDKSKADTLARILVGVQAGWFCAQIIARLAARLPVTILEVNTLGHVACALVMYLIWWHKPRQIREPTILSGEPIAPLCAYMFMASSISGRPHKKLPFHRCPDDADLGHVTFTLDSTIELSEIKTGCSGSKYSGQFRDSSPDHPITKNNRWALAAQAVGKYTAISDKLACIEHGVICCRTCSDFRLPMEELVAPSISDWPTEQLLRHVNSLIMGATLWSATIVYGAVHTAAWRSYFPTLVEKWLWHASSLFVAFSGLLWVFINSIAKLCPQIDEFWIYFLQRKSPLLVDIVILFLCTICGISYIFSRAYLVIEAFISLRQLPVSAYTAPSWIQVVPHL